MLKQIGQTYRKTKTNRYHDELAIEYKTGYDRKTGNAIVKIDSKLVIDALGRVCLDERRSRWDDNIQFHNKKQIIKEMITGKHNIGDEMTFKGFGILRSKGWDTEIEYFKTRKELESKLKETRQKYKIEATLKDIIKKVKKK